MKKGILSLLILVFAFAVASTAMAAPSERALEVRKAYGLVKERTQGSDGIAVDDGVLK